MGVGSKRFTLFYASHLSDNLHARSFSTGVRQFSPVPTTVAARDQHNKTLNHLSDEAAPQFAQMQQQYLDFTERGRFSSLLSPQSVQPASTQENDDFNQLVESKQDKIIRDSLSVSTPPHTCPLTLSVVDRQKKLPFERDLV